MAEQLVESLAAEFDPKKYKDTWREEVLALLEKKAEGEEIVSEAPDEEPRGKVVNLMEALQRSLAAAKKGEAPGTGEVRHKAEPEHRAAARKRSAPKAKRATRAGRSRRAAHR
jgi:DNA end-binding protein Ku